ncbi:MAG: amidohydrolase family protein [Gemmatimonadota bacterium]
MNALDLLCGASATPRRFARGLLVALGTLPAAPALVAAQEPAAPEAMLAIVGGYLIDGNDGPPVRDAVVLVRGDRIVRVGTVADTPVPAEAERIDADGYTVLPGLWDTHVHTMIVGHGIYDAYFPKYEARFREIMPISARELLLAGVTSARDLGAPLDDILWLKREIAAGRIPGPRLFVSGPFLQKSLPSARGTSYDSSIQDSFRWTVDGPDDARAKTRRLIEAGVDVIKVIQLGQLSREEREAIAEEARRAGKPIAVHAGSHEELLAAAEMGVASVEHVGARPLPLYPEESVRLMAENRIRASITSVVHRIYDITEAFPERLDAPRLKRDLPPDLYADVRSSLESPGRLNYFAGAKSHNRYHEAKIRQLYDGGVQIVVGTDSGTPMNFHYESTWQEMDLLSRAGIPPLEVIGMATRHAALLDRVGADLGTIEPGKLADILIVHGNPLRHMSALRNVVHVIKGGRVMVRDGALVAAEETSQ